MIRPLRQQDLDTVMDIWLNANAEAHHFIDKAFWEEHVPMVRELLPQAEVWVCEKAGEIAGFIGIAEQGYIAGLFVAPGRQSGGVGGELVSHAKQRHERLSLSVYIDNEKAVRFYQKQGFAIAEETVNEDTGHREYAMEWNKSPVF